MNHRLPRTCVVRLATLLTAAGLCATTLRGEEAAPAAKGTSSAPLLIYKRPGANPKPTKEPAKSEASGPPTLLEIDLMASDATIGLDSQTWARVFDKLGRQVRVRSGELGEEPGISEVKRGPLRTVKVVGRIDRNGTLTLPGKTFRSGDEQRLKEWLDERETYGAQGSPEGQKNWGLNEDQFDGLFKQLGTKIENDVATRPLKEIAEEFGFGTEIPFRVHTTAEEVWSEKDAPLVALQEVKGLSHGSGFAALLADQGLCMRPLRTPSGEVELVVQPRADVSDPWPVGWPVPQTVKRSDAVPGLFAFATIGFPDRPLIETVREATIHSGVVVAVDFWKAAQRGIDLNQVGPAFPQQRTTWLLVLKKLVDPTQLQAQYRIDESGTGFVWYTPFESRPAVDK